MTLDNQGLGEQFPARHPKKGAGHESKGSAVLPQKKRLAITELPELPQEDRDLEDRGEEIRENGLTFSQMLEESSKGSKFQEGEVVEGIIVRADHDYVTIDIGYKSEGVSPRQRIF